MRTLVTIMFALLVCASCNSQQAGVKNLEAGDFEKGISQKDAQLVDVRTPEEYQEKHIAGAQNININDPAFEKQMQELDKTKPVYIYCLAGGRSKRAADFAAKNGFTDVSHLEPGINGWLAENKTVVSGTGEKVDIKGSGMSFDDYLNHLKASPKLVLVDFNAKWCGPCKVLKPTVAKVVKENAAKVDLFDIDVDKNGAVASTMNIRGIPLIILYKQGKEVWRNMGLVDEETLAAKVKQFSN